MKAWNFKAKNNPKEISKILESSFKEVNGFAFNLNRNKNDSAQFKIRKRALETFQIGLRNNIIVNGKIEKTNLENETNLEITFNQHILMKLRLFVNLLFGIGFIALLIVKSSSVYAYVVGGILLMIGILFWLDTNKRFERNVQDYKKLIAGMLGV